MEGRDKLHQIIDSSAKYRKCTHFTDWKSILSSETTENEKASEDISEEREGGDLARRTVKVRGRDRVGNNSKEQRQNALTELSAN
jgi:hypothetical protein